MIAPEQESLHYRHRIWPAHHTRILDIPVCRRSMGEKVITGLSDFPKNGNHDDANVQDVPCSGRHRVD